MLAVRFWHFAGRCRGTLASLARLVRFACRRVPPLDAVCLTCTCSICTSRLPLPRYCTALPWLMFAAMLQSDEKFPRPTVHVQCTMRHDSRVGRGLAAASIRAGRRLHAHSTVYNELWLVARPGEARPFCLSVAWRGAYVAEHERGSWPDAGRSVAGRGRGGSRRRAARWRHADAGPARGDFTSHLPLPPLPFMPTNCYLNKSAKSAHNTSHNGSSARSASSHNNGAAAVARTITGIMHTRTQRAAQYHYVKDLSKQIDTFLAKLLQRERDCVTAIEIKRHRHRHLVIQAIVLANLTRAKSPVGTNSDSDECEEGDDNDLMVLGGAVTASGGEKRAKSAAGAVGGHLRKPIFVVMTTDNERDFIILLKTSVALADDLVALHSTYLQLLALLFRCSGDCVHEVNSSANESVRGHQPPGHRVTVTTPGKFYFETAVKDTGITSTRGMGCGSGAGRRQEGGREAAAAAISAESSGPTCAGGGGGRPSAANSITRTKIGITKQNDQRLNNSERNDDLQLSLCASAVQRRINRKLSNSLVFNIKCEVFPNVDFSRCMSTLTKLKATVKEVEACASISYIL
ncbi:hypothetical protein MSG28_001863 [Choristoneura fumiferana]|uniref:Uncharacterized protein n=1 Tax=Choristoneura fumiferana TaxID=7141 RepID=A0ACC0KWC1_CHOFU|nr:hypothetical protein MSG28_001863 [Choristoneura fumiferana]